MEKCRGVLAPFAREEAPNSKYGQHCLLCIDVNVVARASSLRSLLSLVGTSTKGRTTLAGMREGRSFCHVERLKLSKKFASVTSFES